MKSGLLLDVVIRKCPTVFQLFASKDQALLIWRNAFFVLDLGLDVIDGVGSFNVECDGLASQSLYEDLHVVASDDH